MGDSEISILRVLDCKDFGYLYELKDSSGLTYDQLTIKRRFLEQKGLISSHWEDLEADVRPVCYRITLKGRIVLRLCGSNTPIVLKRLAKLLLNKKAGY